MPGVWEILVLMGVVVIIVAVASKRLAPAPHKPMTVKPYPHASFSPDPEKSADVIVVGGGPAGSQAAYCLARAGRQVMLLEKAHMPRRKLCGGALSQKAIDYLDFEIPEDLVDNRACGIRVRLQDEVSQGSKPNPVVSLVTRSRFDHFLFNKAREAGADARTEKVISIDDNGAHFRVTTSAGVRFCRALILAEGMAGRFYRHVRRPDTNSERGFCLEADIPVPEDDPRKNSRDIMEVSFDHATHGYGWVFHHGAYYSVGIGGLLDTQKDPREQMRRFLADNGFEDWPANTKGHLIPLGGVKRRVYGTRSLLVGDAAGFVDPFSGEGLAYAIRSGQLAAACLDECLAADDLSDAALARYDHLCEREFGNNLVWGLRFTRLLYAWPNVFLRIFSASDRLITQFLDIPLGQASYRRILPQAVLALPYVMLKPRSRKKTP